MWSILIAVLGGAYFVGKMSLEKSASKKAGREHKEWSSALDEWCVNMTDERLENRLELSIYNNPIEAAQTANRLCPFIPDDQQNQTTYLRIILAQQGKIPVLDADFGIKTPLYGPKPVLIARQKYHDFFEFVTWLNTNLKQHGADTGEMLFVPSYPKSDSKQYYSMQEAEGLLVPGRYEWAPQNICAYLDGK